ncbi:hypothetical protein FNV43_RR14766 [Rhamnella rubrinervis]|uniref:Uncharacterized protein n=1 Tax=Rhamnella rubrinervis TaxID=2594499 RepID=A0A8K0MGR3_9ROSA|nr:hypothetical protein FNV43_RR14766 [Rhamnella rubrinervis]
MMISLRSDIEVDNDDQQFEELGVDVDINEAIEVNVVSQGYVTTVPLVEEGYTPVDVPIGFNSYVPYDSIRYKPRKLHLILRENLGYKSVTKGLEGKENALNSIGACLDGNEQVYPLALVLRPENESHTLVLRGGLKRHMVKLRILCLLLIDIKV